MVGGVFSAEAREEDHARDYRGDEVIVVSATKTRYIQGVGLIHARASPAREPVRGVHQRRLDTLQCIDASNWVHELVQTFVF